MAATPNWIEIVVGRSARFVIIALAILVTLAGCDKEPLIPFSEKTPPLILVPAAEAGIEDGRGRFREIYCQIRDDHGKNLPDDRPCPDALWELADEPKLYGSDVAMGPSDGRTLVVVIPGIFGECIIKLVSPFSYALKHLEKEHGYRTDVIPVSGLGSSEHNAIQIDKALKKMDIGPQDTVILIGYSKGIADILEALINHSAVARKVTAVVSIAGTVGGSPIADGTPDVLSDLLSKISDKSCGAPEGDPGGVESLKRSTRLKWLSENRLPASVRYFSLAAFAKREQISRILHDSYDQLSWLDPRNDSQVLFSDAIIPGSTLLGYAKADHWAIALPFARKGRAYEALISRNAFPREVLLEAVVRFVEESLRNGPSGGN